MHQFMVWSHHVLLGTLGELIVSEVYKHEYGMIQNKFVRLFLDVTKILENKDCVTLEDLKELLTSYPELENLLQEADTIRKVMRVVRDHCSFISYYYLDAIAEYFNISEITDKVKRFEQSVEEFCKHSLEEHSYVSSFLANQSKHLLSAETISFKLEWSPHNNTLTNIKGLLRKTFKTLASQTQVVCVRGGCVEVICYAPLYLMGALVKLARERRKMLVESKVTYLSVGYTIVVDNSVEKKVNRITFTHFHAFVSTCVFVFVCMFLWL